MNATNIDTVEFAKALSDDTRQKIDKVFGG